MGLCTSNGTIGYSGADSTVGDGIQRRKSAGGGRKIGRSTSLEPFP